ncbi:hypothetical protein WJX72_006643 [[Myrmecia] bisecta]|uniref:Uncharacterized protein n=1 Tax=[Myrmecia] bisecta TaxID=41462 RepID=A0AAW1QFV6_9CHLO
MTVQNVKSQADGQSAQLSDCSAVSVIDMMSAKQIKDGLRQAENFKDTGNSSYGRKDFTQAFADYTKGILAALRSQGGSQADSELDSQDEVRLFNLRFLEKLTKPNLKTLAALYCNRAAAAAALAAGDAGARAQYTKYVLRDTSFAVRVMTAPGSSAIDWDVALVDEGLRQLYCKARVRRATALEAIGNFSTALTDVSCLSKHPDAVAQLPWSLQDWGSRLEYRLGQHSTTQDMSSQPHPPYRDGGNWQLIRPAWAHSVEFNHGSGWAHHTVMECKGQLWCYGGLEGRCPLTMRELVTIKDANTAPLRTQVIRIKPLQSAPYAVCTLLHDPGRHSDAPPGHAWHSAVVYKGVMFIWGGIARDQRWNPNKCSKLTSWPTVWQLKCDAKDHTMIWSKVQGKGDAPPPLRDHTAVVHKDAMYVFGGSKLHEAISLDQLWKFNLKSMKWELENGGAGARKRRPEERFPLPEPRHGHAAWVYKDWIYIFGGMHTRRVDGQSGSGANATVARGMLGDMWRYHVIDKNWEEVVFHGNPPGPRAHMGVASSRNGTVYLLGGSLSNAPGDVGIRWDESDTKVIHCTDFFEFDSSTSCWMQMAPVDCIISWLSARAGASAAVTESGIVMSVGGYAYGDANMAFASCLAMQIQRLTGPDPAGVPALPVDTVLRSMGKGKAKAAQSKPTANGHAAPASNGMHKYGESIEAYYPSMAYESKHKRGPSAVALHPHDLYDALGGFWWACKMFKGSLGGNKQLALTRLQQVVKVFGTARAAGQYLRNAGAMHSLLVQPGGDVTLYLNTAPRQVPEEELDPNGDMQCQDLMASYCYRMEEGESQVVLQLQQGRCYIKLFAEFQHEAAFSERAARQVREPPAVLLAPKAFKDQKRRPFDLVCAMAAVILKRLAGKDSALLVHCEGPACKRTDQVGLADKAAVVKHEAVCLARRVLPLRPELLVPHMKVNPTLQGAIWPAIPFHQCYPDVAVRLRRLKDLREHAMKYVPRGIQMDTYILVIVDKDPKCTATMREHSCLVPDHYNMDRLLEAVRQLSPSKAAINHVKVSSVRLPSDCTVAAAQQLQERSEGKEPCLYTRPRLTLTALRKVWNAQPHRRRRAAADLQEIKGAVSPLRRPHIQQMQELQKHLEASLNESSNLPESETLLMEAHAMVVMYVFTKTALQAVQGPTADVDALALLATYQTWTMQRQLASQDRLILMHPEHRVLHAFIWVTALMPALVLMSQLCGPSIGAGQNRVQASTGKRVLPASLVASVAELKDRHGTATAKRLGRLVAMAKAFLLETQSDTSRWAMGPGLLTALGEQLATHSQEVDAMLVGQIHYCTRWLNKLETDSWEATGAYDVLSKQEVLYKAFCASQQSFGEFNRFLLDTNGRQRAYLDIMVASHNAWLQESEIMLDRVLNSAINALQAGTARNFCPEESLMEPIRRIYTAKPCAHKVVPENPDNLMTAKLVRVALTGNEAWFEEAARLFRKLPGAPFGGVDVELARIFQDLGKGRAAVVFDWAMRLSELREVVFQTAGYVLVACLLDEERPDVAVDFVGDLLNDIPTIGHGGAATSELEAAILKQLGLPTAVASGSPATATSDGSPRPTYRGNWTAENPNKLLPQAIQLVELVLESLLLNLQAVAVFSLLVLADAERTVLWEAALAILHSRLADSLDAAAAFLTEVEETVNQAGSASDGTKTQAPGLVEELGSTLVHLLVATNSYNDAYQLAVKERLSLTTDARQALLGPLLSRNDPTAVQQLYDVWWEDAPMRPCATMMAAAASLGRVADVVQMFVGSTADAGQVAKQESFRKQTGLSVARTCLLSAAGQELLLKGLADNGAQASAYEALLLACLQIANESAAAAAETSPAVGLLCQLHHQAAFAGMEVTGQTWAGTLGYLSQHGLARPLAQMHRLSRGLAVALDTLRSAMMLCVERGKKGENDALTVFSCLQDHPEAPSRMIAADLQAAVGACIAVGDARQALAWAQRHRSLLTSRWTPDQWAALLRSLYKTAETAEVQAGLDLLLATLTMPGALSSSTQRQMYRQIMAVCLGEGNLPGALQVYHASNEAGVAMRTSHLGSLLGLLAGMPEGSYAGQAALVKAYVRSASKQDAIPANTADVYAAQWLHEEHDIDIPSLFEHVRNTHGLEELGSSLWSAALVAYRRLDLLPDVLHAFKYQAAHPHLQLSHPLALDAVVAALVAAGHVTAGAELLLSPPDSLKEGVSMASIHSFVAMMVEAAGNAAGDYHSEGQGRDPESQLPKTPRGVLRNTGHDGGAGIKRTSLGNVSMGSRSSKPGLPVMDPTYRAGNPVPLGLYAFGLTTMLLQGVTTGMTEPATSNLAAAFALFFGGLVQLLAGMWEFKRNAVFGATAFSSYGGFWLSYGLYSILATAGIFAAPAPEGLQMMLSLWGILTFILFICTIALSRALQVLFLSLAATFFLLAGGVKNHTCDQVAGGVGLWVGLVAWYIATAEIVNALWRQTILPLGVMKLARLEPELRDPLYDHGTEMI